jgi:hypothetical protein
MGVTFKPGDTFDAAGVLSGVEGVVDFTNYTLKCQMRNKAGGALLADADIEWNGSLVTPTPAMTIHVDASVTATWPENSQVVFDVVISDPAGNIATTESGIINTSKRVTVP